METEATPLMDAPPLPSSGPTDPSNQNIVIPGNVPVEDKIAALKEATNQIAPSSWDPRKLNINKHWKNTKYWFGIFLVLFICSMVVLFAGGDEIVRIIFSLAISVVSFVLCSVFFYRAVKRTTKYKVNIKIFMDKEDAAKLVNEQGY